MSKLLTLLALAAALNGASFDVASIKPNTVGMPSNNREAKQKITFEPGRLTMVNVAMIECIATAYKVPEYEVSGPAWMKTARFDIDAKAAGPASAEEMRPMLQSLLAERFHLTLHRAQQQMATYVLSAGAKGGKLKPSAQPGTPMMDLGGGAVQYRNYSIEQFAASLGGPPFRVQRPVVDRTAIEGQYDFSLRIAADNFGMKQAFEAASNDSEDAPSLVALVRDQLGLKMTPRKELVKVLVIDGSDKEPSAN